MCNKNYIVLLKSFELKKNTYKEVTTFFLHFLKRYMGRGGGKNEPALNPPLYAAMCLVTLQKISIDTPPPPPPSKHIHICYSKSTYTAFPGKKKS